MKAHNKHLIIILLHVTIIVLEDQVMTAIYVVYQFFLEKSTHDMQLFDGQLCGFYSAHD